MYWLQLMDKYAANWSVLLIAISECVLIAWIYGSQRFLNDIQGMIGKRSRVWNCFWGVMWRYITPATLLVTLESLNLFIYILNLSFTVHPVLQLGGVQAGTVWPLCVPIVGGHCGLDHWPVASIHHICRGHSADL